MTPSARARDRNSLVLVPGIEDNDTSINTFFISQEPLTLERVIFIIM